MEPTVAIFALTTRGLEAVSAGEMAALTGLRVRQVAYRRVQATYAGPPAALLTLRTVDDVFLYLAEWRGIGRARSNLAVLTELSAQLDPAAALAVRRQVQPLGDPPTFSVTASFVGKRNYSSDEIKQAVAAGIQAAQPWVYRADDQESDLSLRLFIEHELTWVGLRLGGRPLHRRAKQVHLPGSLKPPVAAALLRLAGVRPGTRVLDPCCGAGTILVEAAALGAVVQGGDIDPAAVQAAHANARTAGVEIDVQCWDVRRLPLATGSAACIVSNLPWGRQVAVGQPLAPFYRATCRELRRVLAPSGRIVLLTDLPDLVTFPDLVEQERREISLFGQTPTILRYTG
jgi:23S rRNA G2445 N2-methylase RlmL